MNYLPGWASSKTIIVDANIAANAVLPLESASRYLSFFERWRSEEVALFAPAFWIAEVTSVIRQYAYRKMISQSQARRAVKDFYLLDVEILPLDEELCIQALDWAEKIQHSKIYDSLYLALSERLGAEFWTSDKKLTNAAHAAGAQWVHWVGDVAE